MAEFNPYNKDSVQKRNDISWMNAKNNAVQIAIKRIEMATPETWKKEITEWTEFIYSLEPTTLKKQAPKGRVTPSQKDFLKVLYQQKENRDVSDEEIDNLGVYGASKEITRLKALPTINQGDGDFRDDYLGNKEQEIIDRNGEKSSSGFQE